MPLYRWEIIRRKKPLIGPQIHDVSQVLYLPFDKDYEPYSVEPYNPTQVLRLPFEDPPQEITYDRSGYGNDGTIYGAARVIGKVRNALKFDGVDDYVDVPDSPSLVSDYISIICWFKSAVDPHYSNVYEKSAGATAVFSLYTRPTSPYLVFRITKGADDNQVVYTANPFDGKWHHFVATYDGSNLRLYVDGSLVDTTPWSGTLPDTTGFSARIGGEPRTYGGYLDGIIDELRIYNRALSQSEIKRLMNLRGV